MLKLIDCWYEAGLAAVEEYALGCYRVVAGAEEVRLHHIYILSEQGDGPLWGLGSNADFDREYGCGLKVKYPALRILKIGTGDSAFC